MDLLKNIKSNFMEKVSCMIKKIYNNKVVRYSILLTLGIFLLELIFKIIMGLNIFNWSLLRILLGAIILSNIISLLISFLKCYIFENIGKDKQNNI